MRTTLDVARPPRIDGFDYRGLQRYFVTFCTFQRHQTFNDSTVATLVVTQLRRTARAKHFAVLAYCLMPDHLHLLVEGTSAAADLRTFVKSLKQSSGQRSSRWTKQPLWQEGYYDRVLRPSDDAKQLARYILNNPVRAGLVKSPGEYPLLGSELWSVTELLNSVT